MLSKFEREMQLLRITAEGSDWKRDEGESLIAWSIRCINERRVLKSRLDAPCEEVEEIVRAYRPYAGSPLAEIAFDKMASVARDLYRKWQEARGAVPCCAEYVTCHKRCVPRADHWKRRAEAAEREAFSWKESHKVVIAALKAAEQRAAEAVTRERRYHLTMTNALNYINHIGANKTMKGEPHPQQWLVDELEAAIRARSEGEGT